jgi:hypothetical protein
MKKNYLKILTCLLLLTALYQNSEAQTRLRQIIRGHVPVARDTAHHWTPDSTAWVRDTAHHTWVRDTTHHTWVRDTTHTWVRDTTHHTWVRDTTHHTWVRDTTHTWVRDTTHHTWVRDTTHTWVRDTTHTWVRDTTHYKVLRVKSSIYPNPSMSGVASINIDAPATETFTVNVYNTAGILVTTQSVTGGTTLLSILTSGFYYYQVINSSGVKVSGGIIVVSQ